MRRESFLLRLQPLGRLSRFGAVTTVVLLGTAAYLLLHLWSLPWFPFVHSDEAWLASLSRTIWLSRDPGVTEEFFRLTPRHPHAIKTLYHLLQGPLVAQWWGPVTARMASLLAGMVAVLLTGRILWRLTGSVLVSVAMAAAFALDVQVFYISHMARQEALILAATMGAVLVAVRAGGHRSAVAAGAILGLSVFVHPNAFVAACAAAPWMAVCAERGRRLSSLLVYGGVLAVAAVSAVGASLALDPQFVANYLAFGESVGVGVGLLERRALLWEFFSKMATRRAGTYYLSPVAPQLFALAAVSIVSVITALGRHATRRGTVQAPLLAGAASVAATVAALFVIGKYSPPSVVFLLPWLYILTGLLADTVIRSFPRRRVAIAFMGLVLALAVLASGLQLARELSAWYPDRCDTGPSPIRYEAYRERIRAAVPRGEVALANLNTAFAFAPGELQVWRDLGALPPSEGEAAPTALLERPLATFLRSEQVRWIVLPVEELAMIYRERPVWNNVYGNPHRFYPDLMAILNRHGTLVDRFEGGQYAMRLVPFMDRGPHHVEIYRLDIP